MYLSQFLYRAYRPSSSFIAKWDCHLPFFPLPRMAPTIVGWKQKAEEIMPRSLAAAGIPSSALPAPRGGLCMRATTSPTFWMVPTTNNTRTGRRTGSAPTSMQIGPSSLPYLLSDLRIHNLRRVRVMMPQTGLRLWGPLRVSRFHLPLPDGQIRKCFVRKLLTRIINGVERIEWGRDQLLRRMRLMRVTVRRCPFHVSPIVAMSLSQPDLAPFSSLMKRRQWRKNQMAAAEIDSQHRRLQKRSPPNNIIPTLQITSR